MATQKRSRKPTYTKVLSIDHLQELVADKTGEFWLILNYGGKSVKYIEYDTETKKFHVEHNIDNTVENITRKKLESGDTNNIASGIKNGALWLIEIVGQ